MPLHLLGKKSWNVYNPANIARVKADEAAAAAKQAADEQRMQELDAERRAAILRGQTPPPLPDEGSKDEARGTRRRDRERERDGHDRKRRRLAGEDDTDRDIRLARKVDNDSDDEKLAILKLRQPKSDAPLIDHAGNINLFPVDLKEVGKREKNAEAEKEKKRKERALEDQYTMRLSNAPGKNGFGQPWYTASKANEEEPKAEKTIGYPGFQDKDVWGREDPRRKEREQARIISNDPLAFMNKAQVQLKRSKEGRKKWAGERDRELRELRAAQEREHSRDRHGKRKREHDEDHKKHHRKHHRRHSRSRERSSGTKYDGVHRDERRSHRSAHQSPDRRSSTHRIPGRHDNDRRK